MKKELIKGEKNYFLDIRNAREKPWYVELDISINPAHQIYSGEGRIMGVMDEEGQLYFYEHNLSRTSVLKSAEQKFDISSYDAVQQAVRFVFLITQEEGGEERRRSERLQNRILRSRLNSSIRRWEIKYGKK